MKDWQSQAHVKWDCKYHVVIVPKYRKKTLYGRLRREMGKIFGLVQKRLFWGNSSCGIGIPLWSNGDDLGRCQQP